MYNEDAPKSERIFSQLTSAWYNWTVAEMLNEKSVHAWALTAAYYSMVHAARTLISLTSCYRSDFVKSHAEFLKFLGGQKYSLEHKQSKEELSTTLKVSPDSVDRLFCRLHEVLGTFKRAREMTSYEKYIIAHQFRADIGAFLTLTQICGKANAYAADINEQVSELTYRYVRFHKLSAYYIHHLKEEITQFEELLEKEHLATPKELQRIVNKFRNLITHVNEPTDLRDFMERTKGYPSKDKSYEELRSVLSQINALDRLSVDGNS